MTEDQKSKKPSKKQRAAAEHEKHLKEKMVIEAEKKDKEEKKSRFKEIPFSNKLSGILLCLIGVFLLSFVGWFLYFKMFDPKDLSDLLPADDTIAFIQIDIKNKHIEELSEKLKTDQNFSKKALIEKIEEFLNTDFAAKIQPWLGYKMGAALLNSETTKNNNNFIFFISYKDKAGVLDFLKSLKIHPKDELKEEKFKRKTIYEFSLSESFKFTFINQYLVIGNNREILKDIIGKLAFPEKNVRNDRKFIEIANNLSLNRFVFGYVNMEKLLISLPRSKTLNGKDGNVNFIKPFFNVFLSSGFSAASSGNGMILQTYAAFDKNKISDRGLFREDRQYKGNLIGYLENDPGLIWGGDSLENQVKRVLKLLDEIYPSSSLLAEAAIRAQLNEYLGNNVSLEDDIYPLFKNEFIFVFNEPQKYKLLIELPNKTIKDKFENLKKNFLSQKGFLVPEVKQVTDPSGKTNWEMSAKEEAIKENIINYSRQNISEINLNLPSQVMKFYFSIINKTGIITNDLNSIKKTIDLIQKGGKSFKNTAYFNVGIKEIIQSADEITFVKSDLIKILFPKFAPYLRSIKYLTSSQNVFDDGISTLHYLGF